MSICADKHNENEPGSVQILRHIKKADTPMQDVRDLMVNILKQYQSMDKIGHSLGVLEKHASFSDHVSWCGLVAKLDQKKDSLDETAKSHLVESLDYLGRLSSSIRQQVVGNIQKMRDRWMYKVLFIDTASIILLVTLIMMGLFWSGFSFNEQQVVAAVQLRPLFFGVTISLSLILAFLLHLFIRRVVIDRMMEQNQGQLLPGMSLSRALQRNTRNRHSIFRPEPVGWNFLQKKRLAAVAAKTDKLRQQMIDVLEQYPSNKKVNE